MSAPKHLGADDWRKKPRGEKVPGAVKVAALSMAEAGFSVVESSRTFGISRELFYRTKRDLVEPDAGLVERYRKYRSALLTQSQMDDFVVQESMRARMLGAGDEMTTGEAIAAYNAVSGNLARTYDRERLEEGKSTGNVAVLVQAIHDIRDRERGKIEGGDKDAEG